MKVKFESRIMIPAIIVLLSACIGLIIVKVIDTRLKDISINMPTVNLPTINISTGGAPSVTIGSLGSAVPFPNQTAGAATDEDSKAVGPKADQTGPKEIDVRTMQKTQGAITPDIKITNVQGLSKECHDRTRFVASRYESAKDARKYTGVTPSPSYDHHSRPAIWPASQNVPALDKFPAPLAVAGTEGTYYMDPNNMTSEQIQKFKLKAKFEKMTVQDYTNWLLLFANGPEQLNAFHRANLRIVARGGQLTSSDMPRATAVPPKADQAYMEKISQGSLDNIPQPEYLGYLPYNVDQAINAPVDVLNRNLRHLDFVNPDEPLKTWELTRVSTKLSGSKDSNLKI